MSEVPLQTTSWQERRLYSRQEVGNGVELPARGRSRKRKTDLAHPPQKARQRRDSLHP